MSIILVGYRGSGKTTTGRKLADVLWQPFVDVDEQIVRAAGCSIREIFAQEGEQRFRDMETRAVAKVSVLQDTVIALGGGALARVENRDLLKTQGHKIIYLRCEPEELLRRILADPQTSATRPNLTALAGGLDEIRTLLAQREPIYRQMMHGELDVTQLTPDEAAVRIVKLL